MEVAEVVAWCVGSPSAVFGVVRLRDRWQSRFRLSVVPLLRDSPTQGHEITIHNLYARQVNISYYELVKISGWPFFRSETCLSSPEGHRYGVEIGADSSHTMDFAEDEFFSTSAKALRGKKIILRLHIAGKGMRSFRIAPA